MPMYRRLIRSFINILLLVGYILLPTAARAQTYPPPPAFPPMQSGLWIRPDAPTAALPLRTPPVAPRPPSLPSSTVRKETGDLRLVLRARADGPDIEYELIVQNHTRDTFRDIDAVHQFFVHSDHMEILSSASGTDRGDRITWNFGYLRPFEHKVLTYRVRFNGIPVASSRAEATSDNPVLHATASHSVPIGRGTPGGDRPPSYNYNYDAIHYPRTGAGDFFGSLNNSKFLTPVARTASSETQTMMIAFTLLLAGVGGAIAMRKLKRSY